MYLSQQLNCESEKRNVYRDSLLCAKIMVCTGNIFAAALSLALAKHIISDIISREEDFIVTDIPWEISFQRIKRNINNFYFHQGFESKLSSYAPEDYMIFNKSREYRMIGLTLHNGPRDLYVTVISPEQRKRLIFPNLYINN